MAERVIYPVFHSAVSGLGPGGVGLHPAVLSLKSAVPCGQDPLRWSLSSRVGGYHTLAVTSVRSWSWRNLLEPTRDLCQLAFSLPSSCLQLHSKRPGIQPGLRSRGCSSGFCPSPVGDLCSAASWSLGFLISRVSEMLTPFLHEWHGGW